MWAELDDIDCPCLGSGWADIIPDEWQECPIHFHGQLHPQSRLLLLDEPKKLAHEERRALLNYQIQQSKNKIQEMQNQLKREQGKLFKLELELVNKTPTIRAFPAVHEDDYPEIEIK